MWSSSEQSSSSFSFEFSQVRGASVMPLRFLAVEIAHSHSAIVSPGAVLCRVECAVTIRSNASTVATMSG